MHLIFSCWAWVHQDTLHKHTNLNVNGKKGQNVAKQNIFLTVLESDDQMENA